YLLLKEYSHLIFYWDNQASIYNAILLHVAMIYFYRLMIITLQFLNYHQFLTQLNVEHLKNLYHKLQGKDPGKFYLMFYTRLRYLHCCDTCQTYIHLGNSKLRIKHMY